MQSLRSLGLFLVPSFVTSLYDPDRNKVVHANSAAALDGLRGLACLFVFNEHVSYHISHAFLMPYGKDGLNHFILHPFIRLFWSGFAMVAIFFAISGYVLSIKSLKQIQAGDMLGFNKTITSSLIRRGLRLYMPTTAAIMISASMAWLGLFNHSHQIWYTRPDLNLHERPVPYSPILHVQLWDAWKHAWGMMYAWNFDSEVTPGDYDLHLWTIPVEFRSSIFLFLVLIGVARLRNSLRPVVEVAILVYSIIVNRREVLLFVGGMFLADLDQMRAKRRVSAATSNGEASIALIPMTNNMPKSEKLPRWTTSESAHRVRTQLAWLVVMITGMFLASAAVEHVEDQYGFRTLAAAVPMLTNMNTGDFLRALGALLVTAATANSTWLSVLFTNRVSVYLGQISYALYIVHGNVIKIVEYAMLPGLYPALCHGSPNAEHCSTSQLGLVWLCVMAVVLPITFWSADVFWRAIDVPSVRFARWLENKICRVLPD